MRELDILIDLAHAVATDFFARPQRRKQVDAHEPAERIARLHARYGSDERILSYERRAALFAPLLGDGDFARYRDGLPAAAAICSEWGQATGLAMRRAAVRSARGSLEAHLSRFSVPRCPGAGTRRCRMSPRSSGCLARRARHGRTARTPRAASWGRRSAGGCCPAGNRN